MKLMCKAFGENEVIPKKYTCNGEDISPPLFIEKVPDEAKSLALIMDDPDAPGGTFDHWIVHTIPPHTTSIAEGVAPGIQGINGFGNVGYGGPCPPSGTHHYFFKLFALDDHLELAEGAERRELEEAMKGHILARAELMGRYSKSPQ